MTTGPFDALNAKRRSGAKKVILGIGDSTFIGYGSGNDGGWLTRLGKRIGSDDNINVFWKAWDEAAGWPAGWTQIWTGTSGNGALYIYDGAIGGHDLLAMIGWMSASKYVNPYPGSDSAPLLKVWAQADHASLNPASGFVAEAPDLIFQGSAVNDWLQPSWLEPGNVFGFTAKTSNLDYLARYDTLIGLIQAQCSGVPLVVTSMNQWNPDSYSYLFTLLANHLGVPSPSRPFSTVLQQAEAYSNVWMLDTQQAIPSFQCGVTATSSGWSGVPRWGYLAPFGATTNWIYDPWHLNAVGNQQQADWMYGIINGGGTSSGSSSSSPSSSPPSTPNAIPVFSASSLALNTITWGQPFSQTLVATGAPITWSITGALPSGLYFDKNTGRIYGTPI